MSKFNEIGRLPLNISFFSRMVQMGRCFLTMCTTPVHEEKNIKQMCRYKKENGRSMVEMLGVLAIIGVLSVGAIAGYSKAMFKYKMNKSLDMISHTIARIVELNTLNFKLQDGEEITGTPQELVNLGFDCEEKDAYESEFCALPNGVWTYLKPEGVDTLMILIDEEPFDSCVAFFNSEIYKNIPEEWWYRENQDGVASYILLQSDIGSRMLVSKSPAITSQGAKPELTTTDVLEACGSVCKSEFCHILWHMKLN